MGDPWSVWLPPVSAVMSIMSTHQNTDHLDVKEWVNNTKHGINARDGHPDPSVWTGHKFLWAHASRHDGGSVAVKQQVLFQSNLRSGSPTLHFLPRTRPVSALFLSFTTVAVSRFSQIRFLLVNISNFHKDYKLRRHFRHDRTVATAQLTRHSTPSLDSSHQGIDLTPVSGLRIWKAWLQNSDPPRHDVLLDDGFLRIAQKNNVLVISMFNASRCVNESRHTRINGIKATLHAYLCNDAQHTGFIVDMPVFPMKISEAAARKSTVKWGRDLDYSEITIVSLDFFNAVRWIWASTVTDNSGLAKEGESQREAHLSPVTLTTFFCAAPHPPSCLPSCFFFFHPPSSSQATRQISTDLSAHLKFDTHSIYTISPSRLLLPLYPLLHAFWPLIISLIDKKNSGTNKKTVIKTVI